MTLKTATSTAPLTLAAIALGSNLGDSHQAVTTAVSELAQDSQSHLIACSSWYKTAPIGPPQPDYINGCILLQTQRAPLNLLHWLLKLEQKFGRERTQRWGPRTLDLDLILYGDLILQTPQLTLPHPRLRERAFVLVPLAEIWPEGIEPVSGLPLTQLRDRLDCSGVHLLPTSI